MKVILDWIIIIIAAFAINGTYKLVMNEWQIGNICPKILNVPACYIVLVCFSIALLTHIIPIAKAYWVYFVFVGLVTVIALTGTFGELTGMTKCPRTSGGTPMCFISLGICLSLLLLKVVLIRNIESQNPSQ